MQPDQTINGTKYYAKYAIYQKPTNRTTTDRYLFYHMVKAPHPGVSGPENDYRIYMLQGVIMGSNPSLIPYSTSSTNLTSPGNWENALQLNGTPYIGGLHGYEQYTSLKFYADGLNVIPSMTNPVIRCNDLKIIEKANLSNPANLSQVIANITVLYEWNGQNLKITTDYQWKIKAIVTIAYAAMFPTNNSTKVSSMGQIQGLPVENFLTRTINLRANSPNGTVWNNINNLHMSMKILNPSTALNNYLNSGNATSGETWFKSHLNYYNKLYISRVNYPDFEVVNNTTKWHIQTKYTIWNASTISNSLLFTETNNSKISDINQIKGLYVERKLTSIVDPAKFVQKDDFIQIDSMELLNSSNILNNNLKSANTSETSSSIFDYFTKLFVILFKFIFLMIGQ